MRWRNIPGYRGYRISSNGVVESCLRRAPIRDSFGRIYAMRWATKRDEFRRLAQVLRGSGQPYWAVCLAKNKTKRLFCVHRLMLLSFFGRPKNKNMVACHNDGNIHNNSLSNLRWDTHKNNSADKFLHGTIMRGERCPHAKLSDMKVKLIRKSFSAGTAVRELADSFLVDRSTIRLVVRRKIWKHVS